MIQILFGQEAKIGEIKNVQKTGLQLVLLSPQVISEAENNVDFIRINEAKSKKEVPYVVYLKPETTKKSFLSFPIASKTKTDSLTSFVISNEKQIQLNELFVIISNSSVSKEVNISGSNDGKEWFGLVQNHLLSNLEDNKLQQVEKSIVLPFAPTASLIAFTKI